MISRHLNIDVRKILMSEVRKSVTKVLMSLIVLSLAGCGAKSAPSQPENSSYPRHYPKQTEAVGFEQRKKETKYKRDANAFYQYPNRLKQY